jgi:hypothetical protein
MIARLFTASSSASGELRAPRADHRFYAMGASGVISAAGAFPHRRIASPGAGA